MAENDIKRATTGRFDLLAAHAHSNLSDRHVMDGKYPQCNVRTNVLGICKQDGVSTIEVNNISKKNTIPLSIRDG